MTSVDFAPPVASSGVLLERHFALADEAATQAFGARLARALRAQCATARFAGMQIHLLGELGAGKTALVRATLRALGHAARVRSPTYTLVEPYALATPHGELRLYHFDLYRFSDPAEWADAGLREYFDSGAVCFVEWPQRAQGLTGVPDLVFMLEYGTDGERDRSGESGTSGECDQRDERSATDANGTNGASGERSENGQRGASSKRGEASKSGKSSQASNGSEISNGSECSKGRSRSADDEGRTLRARAYSQQGKACLERC